MTTAKTQQDQLPDPTSLAVTPPAGVGHAPTPADNAAPTTAVELAVTQRLTPEEQMALFEKELKEKDWGHQPC